MENEAIATFDQVWDYLQRQEIVYIRVKSEKTYFFRKDGHIYVRAVRSSYSLSEQQFIELFADQAFYLYKPDPTEIRVDLDKDDEYYAWKSKAGH